MVIFRDKKTGRFVSRSTWKQSKAHGGNRYVRERKPAQRTRRPARRALTEEEIDELEEQLAESEEEEIAGGFDSP